MANRHTRAHETELGGDADFDIVKVNRVREQVRRGAFRVDSTTVAERLLSDHLLWRWVLGGGREPHSPGPQGS